MSDVKEMNLDQDDQISLLDIVIAIRENIKLLTAVPLLCGLAAFGISYLIKPTYTAETSFLTPQQNQSAAVSMLQGIGSLGGLAGAASGLKNPADQYVALMKSRSVKDAMVKRFNLQQRYEATLHEDARRGLDSRDRVTASKDGLIKVEVDDTEPAFAAHIANAHIEELRKLLSRLAVTEAQRRRAFYENQLEQAKIKLTEAQTVLQGSGIQEGALRAEPRMAAEAYARLKTEVTSAQVKIHAMRTYLAEQSPEFKLAQSNLAALTDQLRKAEQVNHVSADDGYISRYREFKYQETLFEMYAKQFELAKLDEAREGAIVQVVDFAEPPERKSRPNRLSISLVGVAVSGLLVFLFVVVGEVRRRQALI